jgi:hypothetical protein
MTALDETLAIPCSLESEQAGESLAGTAPRAQVWFALEYRERWEHKAWEQSSIDAAIRQAVDAQLAGIAGARLLLIKQKDRAAHLRFFAAVLGEQPALYTFELSSYAELAELDLTAIAAGAPQYAAQRSQQPLLLVCTNGQRDACCVLHGIGVYNRLQREFGDAVWESSHLGGHRYAANLLALPSGRAYGRLRADNALEVGAAVMAGALPLAYCRGYTAWEPAAQAAELLLRQRLQLSTAEGPRLLAGAALDETRWQGEFALADGSRHRVSVVRELGAPVHASCGDAKTTTTVELRLV